MVDGLAQERERLVGFSFVQCDSAQVVSGHGGIGMIGAENAALNLKRLKLQFLSLAIVTFDELHIGEIVHRHEGVTVVWSEYTPPDVERFAQHLFSFLIVVFHGERGCVAIHD